MPYAWSRRAFLAVLTSLLASVLAACAAPQSAVTQSGSTGSTVAARTGISTGGALLWETDSTLRRDLDTIAASGAKWVRVDFDWNSVQADGPTSFRWDRAQDRVVAEARARGLSVLGGLAYSPGWARRDACAGTKFCLPKNPDDYARFAAAAASRYGSRGPDPAFRNSVTAWEIWNEPNHFPFVQPTVDVPGYAMLLKRAYPAIKGADPNAIVVTGGMSPAPNSNDGRDVAPATFVEGLYANGAAGSFDAVGDHPYSFPYSPYDTASWNAFTQARDVHDRMSAHGDGNKRIWATELGAPTGTDPGMSVDETRQAQLVHDYFRAWFEGYAEFAGPMFWYQHRDNGTNLSNYDDNFGLVRRDWSQKPAFAAFQQETRR